MERAVHRVQYGARMKVDEGDKIKRGQRIAEWDPYTRPILTEVEGIVDFEDLVEGASMSEAVDKSTGIAKRMVIDWRLNQRSVTLKPAILLKGADGKVLKLARGGDARYTLPVDAIIGVDPGSKIKAGDIVARVSMKSAKTRDITGGLPRVAELFEARRPKDHAIIAEASGTVQKENVIVGRLIPAGTGAAMAKLRQIATGRDEMILAQKAKSAPRPLQLPPAVAAAAGESVPKP